MTFGTSQHTRAMHVLINIADTKVIEKAWQAAPISYHLFTFATHWGMSNLTDQSVIHYSILYT